jgi:hypothetical protein
MSNEVLSKLYTERQALQEKIRKLKAFINESIVYEVLAQEKKDLLLEQLMVMNSYEDILSRRILLE